MACGNAFSSASLMGRCMSDRQCWAMGIEGTIGIIGNDMPIIMVHMMHGHNVSVRHHDIEKL